MLLTREKGRAQGEEGRVWGREEVCLGWAGADLIPAADAGLWSLYRHNSVAGELSCWWPLDRAMTGR